MDIRDLFCTSKGGYAVWLHEQLAALLAGLKSRGVRIGEHIIEGNGEGSVSRNKKGLRSSEETCTRIGEVKYEKENEVRNSEGDTFVKPSMV